MKFCNIEIKIIIRKLKSLSSSSSSQRLTSCCYKNSTRATQIYHIYSILLFRISSKTHKRIYKFGFNRLKRERASVIEFRFLFAS